jgi:tetratricopeptide (TPR) repeat protein
MWLASSYLYIGLIYIEFDDMQAALQHTKKSLILSETNNEQNIQGRAHITLGRILGKMESEYSNEIQRHFLAGLEIFDKLAMKPDVAIGNLFLGEFYQAFEKKEKGIKHIKEAKILFDEMHMNYWLSRAKELLNDQ